MTHAPRRLPCIALWALLATSGGDPARGDSAARAPVPLPSPDPAGVTLHLAQHAELVQGDLERALSLYAGIVDSSDDAPGEALVGLVRTLRRLGRHDEARRRAESIDEGRLSGRLRTQLAGERSRLGLPPDHGARDTTWKAKVEVMGEGTGRRVTVNVSPAPEPAPSPSAPRPRSAGVTIDVRDSRLADVTQMIARLANLDVVVAPDVGTVRVTARLTGADPVTALRVIARSVDADLAEWNGTWTVARGGALARLRLSSGAAQTEVTTRPSVRIDFRVYAPGADRQVVASPRVVVRSGDTARVRIGTRTRRANAGPPRVAVVGTTAADRHDIDFTAHPWVEPGTGLIHLDLDLSVGRTRATSAGPEVTQQRRVARLAIRDGGAATVRIGPAPRGSGPDSKHPSGTESSVRAGSSGRSGRADRPWSDQVEVEVRPIVVSP